MLIAIHKEIRSQHSLVLSFAQAEFAAYMCLQLVEDVSLVFFVALNIRIAL